MKTSILSEAVKSGILGGVFGCATSAAVAYFLVGIPANPAENWINNGLSGLFSGVFSGFIGVFLALRKFGTSSAAKQ